MHEFPHLICIFWLSVRSHAHYFVFPFIYLEAKERGKGGIQKTQRMRKMNFFENGYIVSLSLANGGACPFAHSIYRKNSRLFKRRSKKRGSCMRKMVFCEQNFLLRNANFFGNGLPDPQLRSKYVF